MSSQKIFFGKLKERRDWYFVEYSPPYEGCRFASLDLTVISDKLEKEKIVQAMESELLRWLARYSVPLQVSAFDAAENLIHLDPVKKCNSLMGLVSKKDGGVEAHWQHLKNEDLPEDALNRDYLKKIYPDIPFRTDADIQSECQKHDRLIMGIKWFSFFVTVIVPLLMLVLPEISQWVAGIVLTYGLLKILFDYFKQTGTFKKSARQLEREKENLQMRHHDYHCKKNPTGFLRLMSENLDREARDRTRKESEALKSKPVPP